MEVIKFNDIPILEFGNDYVMTGILYTNSNNKSVIVVLPQEVPDRRQIDIMYPVKEDWDKLLRQADTCEVEGIREGQRVILRKGQRNIDSKVMWKVFKRDKYKCRYCGIDHVPMTVDHIITWETGGATHENNLLTSCRKCNKKRGNLPYDKWLQTTYYQEKSQFLTEKVKEANTDILTHLHELETVKVIRNR